MCQEKNCIHCGNHLSGKQTKFCSERCDKRNIKKKRKKKNNNIKQIKIKMNKGKEKSRRQKLIKERQASKEPRAVCPVCLSWDKNTDKVYQVMYFSGTKGKCLNPVCRAEWTIRPPRSLQEWLS